MADRKEITDFWGTTYVVEKDFFGTEHVYEEGLLGLRGAEVGTQHTDFFGTTSLQNLRGETIASTGLFHEELTVADYDKASDSNSSPSSSSSRSDSISSYAGGGGGGNVSSDGGSIGGAVLGVLFFAIVLALVCDGRPTAAVRNSTPARTATGETSRLDEVARNTPLQDGVPRRPLLALGKVDTPKEKCQEVKSHTRPIEACKGAFHGIWSDVTGVEPVLAIDDDGQRLVLRTAYLGRPFTAVLTPRLGRTCPTWGGGGSLPRGGWVDITLVGQDPNLARIEVKGSAGNSKVFHFARETPPRVDCKPATERTRPHQTLRSTLVREKSPLLGRFSTRKDTEVDKKQAVQPDTPHFRVLEGGICGEWVDETDLRPPFVIDHDGQRLVASSTYQEIPYTIILRPEDSRTCPAYTGGKGLPQGGYVRVVFCLVSPNVLRVEMDPVRRKVDRRQHFLMTRNTTSGDELLASNAGGHATGR